MAIKRRFGLKPIESFKKGGTPNTKRLRRNEKKQKKYASKLEDENLSDRKRSRYEKRLNKANNRVAEEQYNAVSWGLNDLREKDAMIQIPIRDRIIDNYQGMTPPSFSTADHKLSREMYDKNVAFDKRERELRAKEEARLKRERQEALRRKQEVEAKRKAKEEDRLQAEEEVKRNETPPSIYNTPEGQRMWNIQRGLSTDAQNKAYEESYNQFGLPVNQVPVQHQLSQWTAADQAASDARAHNQMLYEQQHLYKPLDVGAITNPQDVALQYDRQRANTEAALEMGLLFSAAGTPLGSAKVTPYQAPKQLGGRTVGQKMLGVPNTSTFGRAVPMGNGINDAGRVVNVVQSSGAVHAPGTVMKALPAPKYLPVQSSNPVVGLIRGTNVGPNGQYIIGFKQGGKIKKRFF